MLTEPEDQTDIEAEMLELSGFCSICGYDMKMHNPNWTWPDDAPDSLWLCPNYGYVEKERGNSN